MTNKILAQRVDELTEVLTDVRVCVQEVKEAEDMAEVTHTTSEIVENINKVIGLEDDDEDDGQEFAEGFEEDQRKSGKKKGRRPI